MPKQQTKKENIDHGQVLFFWKFHEFQKHERTGNWYLWAALGFGFLIFYALLARNFLFGMILVIAALLVVLFQRSNRELDFQISEDGIIVGERFYSYDDLKNFYIIYQPPEVKTLYFEPKSWWSPRIPIALENQDPVKIREALKSYLDEDIDKEQEPLSDQLSRTLKL